MKKRNIKKSFGDFCVFVYNKNMKKLVRTMLSILLVVPMIVGVMFLSPNLAHNATQTTQNGGGGGKLYN